MTEPQPAPQPTPDLIRGGLAVEIRSVDGELEVMDFIASDETLDRYGEVVKLDGWDLAEYRRNPVVVDSHDYSSVAKILGRSLSTEVKNSALVNRVQFALDNPIGAMAARMARGGFIRAESVGFYPDEWTEGRTAAEPARTYTRQRLIEISLVAIPANPGAVRLALQQGTLKRQEVGDVIDLLKSLSASVEPTSPTGPGRAAAGVDPAAQLAERLGKVVARLHAAIRG